MQSHFFEANVFDDDNTGLNELYGNVDVVYIGSFLHLWDLERQKEVCEKITRLLRKGEGGMVLGRQVGDPKPGLYQPRVQGIKEVYRHSPETFKRMWEEVGLATGSRWRVDACLRKVDGKGMVTGEVPDPEEEREPETRVWLPKPRLTFAVFREA